MTRGYLLDTNIISNLTRALQGDKSEKALNVLENFNDIKSESNIFICAISTGEIEYGLNVSTHPNPQIHEEVHEVLKKFPEPFIIDAHTASEHYASLRAEIFKKYAPKDKRGRAKSRYIEEWDDPTSGKSLGVNENDVWIASVALKYNLHLVTDDSMDKIVAVAPSNFSIKNWATPKNK